AAALGVLATTACGGSTPASAPGNTAGASNQQAPAGSGQTVTVVIGKAVDTIGFSVVDVALAEHYFQEQGIQVKEELLGGSTQANAAMQGGSIQFACESSSALMLANEKGMGLMAVDSLDYGVPMQLVASNQWIAAHHISPSQPLNDRLKALKGMTYGGVSNTDIGYMKLLVSQAGLTDKDYKIEHLQSQAELAVALSNGRIDAFMGSPPSSLQVLQQGKAQVVVNGKDIPEWRDAAYDILVTTQGYAQQHPDIVKKVATAIAKADNFMREHPDETLAIEQQHFPKISADVLKQSLQLATFAKDGQQSQQQWENAVHIMKGSGLVTGNITIQEGKDWTNQFIDTKQLQ
ncbi:MAG: ABC transporter substrate-binding protein, partial [Alicyclobacillus sp.]|nr:ABC transporter substrate-binding protein [Alicyclobacillus sp.]